MKTKFNKRKKNPACLPAFCPAFLSMDNSCVPPHPVVERERAHQAVKKACWRNFFGVTPADNK